MSGDFREKLTLRRCTIMLSEGKYVASLLFLSKMRSDERTIGPFQKWEELMEFIDRVKYTVEVLGKKAASA